MPSAAPAVAPSPQLAVAPRQAAASILSRLRDEIARIERPRLAEPAPRLSTGAGATDLLARPPQVEERRWILGDPSVDAVLSGGAGLDLCGLHEIKPDIGPEIRSQIGPQDGPQNRQAGRRREAADMASAWAAALGFALRLAARLPCRHGADGALPVHGQGGPLRTHPAPVLVIVVPVRVEREIGVLHASGLDALGLDPDRLLVVRTAKDAETAWAMEETLAARAVDGLVGLIDRLDLTMARRLALAARAQATPCLAVTAARTAPAAAAATRWRVGVAASAPHAQDPCAPGGDRITVRLERRRGSRAAGLDPLFQEPSCLEWCHEAFRFRLAA